MKLPRARHSWTLSPKQAVRLQQRLAKEIRQTPLGGPVHLVAGGDAAFTPDGGQVIAGWVVWDLRAQDVADAALVVRPVRFPYVPGLLSFREAPALIAAARKLEVEPQVFMLDGQGLAHPRRFGLACHLGLLIDRPSIGCAKSRLCGTHDMPPHTPGASAPLVHDGDLVGRVLRTRQGAKPLYISVGHKITLARAVRLTLRCCTKFRLPEPTRLAHQLVSKRRNASESRVAVVRAHAVARTENLNHQGS
jgi:deoxyribonuclease V